MKGHSGRAGEQSGYSRVFLALLALAVAAAIAGLAWSYHLSGRLTHAEAQLSQAQQQNQKLASALNETNARLKITNEALGHSLGSRQKQLEQRARELLKRQRAAAESTEAQQNNSSASTETSDAKAGSGSTQTELKSGEAQLQSIQGDLGLPSGPIATNQDELNFLERRHDRNYYPFTLRKGEKKIVSTVTLELKKADLKHNRYTLIVYADKKIEKKNRGLNEPVQFYTGKDKFLYELVVNNIEKNEVTGYLATPLNAPVPASTSGS